MPWRKFLQSQLAVIIMFLMIGLALITTFWFWHLQLVIIYNSLWLIALIFLIYLLYAFFKERSKYQTHQALAKDYAKLNDELNQQTIQNRDLGDLIKVWSHQMKVPLAAIDMMAQTEIDPQALKNQVFYLENYLSMLLEYQRITNLQNDFVFKQVSVKGTVQTILKKYSHFFIHKHLTVQLSDSDWVLATDERWLSLALEQIISNAVKYTEQGG